MTRLTAEFIEEQGRFNYCLKSPDINNMVVLDQVGSVNFYLGWAERILRRCIVNDPNGCNPDCKLPQLIEALKKLEAEHPTPDF